jgi:hypothetical protein
LYTRDLGLAAFLLQLPLLRRPRLVYESHGVAPVVAAEMPALLGNTTVTPSPRKIARLDRRERRVWTHARGYITITRALADELTSLYGARTGLAVVPDGVDIDLDQRPEPPRANEPAIAAVTPGWCSTHAIDVRRLPWLRPELVVGVKHLRGSGGLRHATVRSVEKA